MAAIHVRKQIFDRRGGERATGRQPSYDRQPSATVNPSRRRSWKRRGVLADWRERRDRCDRRALSRRRKAIAALGEAPVG